MVGFKTGKALLIESPRAKNNNKSVSKGIDLDIPHSTNSSSTKLDYLLNTTPVKRLGLSRSAFVRPLHKA